MLYLDDLAVWVKTQKGSIVRLVVCTVCVLIAIFIGFTESNEKPKLQQTIEDNKIKTAELEYTRDSIQAKIDSFGTITGDSFTPMDIGTPVANWQSEYNQNFGSQTQSSITAKKAEVAEVLTQYCMSGVNINAWYDRQNSDTKWRFITLQTYLINDVKMVKGVFECYMNQNGGAITFNNNNLVAVAICTFNADTQKIENVEYYETRTGSNFRDTVSPLEAQNTNIIGLFNAISTDQVYALYVKGESDITDADTVSGDAVPEDGEADDETDDSDNNEADDEPTVSDDDNNDDSSIIDDIIDNVEGGNK